MGLSQSTTEDSKFTDKGVTYDKRRVDDNSQLKTEIQDCLFCRIIEKREENGAPLWYKDDKVAAFIPRSPAARIHILVVPLLHRKNLHEINVTNVRMSTSQLKTIPPTTKDSITDLLDHMHHVAKELVQYAIDNEGMNKFVGKMIPPGGVTLDATFLMKKKEKSDASSYYSSSTSSSSFSSSINNKEVISSSLSSVVYDFHRPPFNSINHLHLHALLPPFKTISDQISFTSGMPWCCSLKEAKELYSKE